MNGIEGKVLKVLKILPIHLFKSIIFTTFVPDPRRKKEVCCDRLPSGKVNPLLSFILRQ